MATATREAIKPLSTWNPYRTIWRWHFYAGLVCIPFVTWLSITGAIYVFKPQIEAWLDRPYDHLRITGPRASGESQVRAAIAAVGPAASLHEYQLPTAPDSAVRVIVGAGAKEYRVYVHPQTLEILNIADEDKRPMVVLFHLHGDLLAGDRGSMLVELAACWTIVMVLTGLFLWWPRQSWRLAGLLYPRLREGGRIFWKDLHSVTGVWVSFCVLFLLVSGLPWAKNWGGYLKRVREATQTAKVKQDWPTGPSSEMAARMAKNHDHSAMMSEMQSRWRHHGAPAGLSYEPIDRLAAAVAPLHLAYPVLISPPSQLGGKWSARSDAGNRTLRTNMDLDSATGAISNRIDFNQRHWIDQAVGVGVAAHEGQLFFLNQLVNLFTAIGLNILNVSAIAMWWRRRPAGLLGAPSTLGRVGVRYALLVPVVLLSIWLPLLGASIVFIWLLERFVLRRIPTACRWLGLAAA